MRYGKRKMRVNLLLMASLVALAVIAGGLVPAAAAASATFSGATPAPGSTVSIWNPPIVVTATDPAGIRRDGFSMKIDGVSVWAKLAYVTMYSQVTVSFTPTMLTDGVHTGSVTVLNYSIRRTTYSWTFTVRAPPQLSSPSPASVATTTTPTISALVTENGTVASVSIALDGTDIPASYNAATKTVSGTPTTALVDDTDVISTVTVTDAAGAVGTTTWTFHVQIYPNMPDTSGCTICHVTYPASHPMTNCDGCHGPSSPDGSQWTTGSPHGSDPRFAPAVILTDCTWCHNGLYPGVPNHLAPTNTYHKNRTADMSSHCKTCHVSTLTIEHYRRVDSGGNPLTCLTCHASSETTVQAAIASGNTACTDCHDLISPDHRIAGATCTDCHPDEASLWSSSADLHSASAADVLTNVDHNTNELLVDECVQCHSMFQRPLGIDHFITPVDQIGDPPGVWTVLNASEWQATKCEVCHDPSARNVAKLAKYGAILDGPFDPSYTNASALPQPSQLVFDPDTDTYVDTEYIGSSLGIDATKLCATCHDPEDQGGDPNVVVGGHDYGPQGGDSRSFVTASHEGLACTDCHPTHDFTPVDPSTTTSCQTVGCHDVDRTGSLPGVVHVNHIP